MTAADAIRRNVAAILAASEGRGFRRRWIIPGYGNGVRYVANGAGYALAAAVRWPARDHDGAEIARGACLARHRAMVKIELAALAATINPPQKYWRTPQGAHVGGFLRPDGSAHVAAIGKLWPGYTNAPREISAAIVATWSPLP